MPRRSRPRNNRGSSPAGIGAVSPSRAQSVRSAATHSSTLRSESQCSNTASTPVRWVQGGGAGTTAEGAEELSSPERSGKLSSEGGRAGLDCPRPGRLEERVIRLGYYTSVLLGDYRAT